MRRFRILLALTFWLVPGCDEEIVVDGGSVDGGSVDAGRSDAGLDAGARDAGSPARGLCDPTAAVGPFPAPDSQVPNRGPGGPASSFTGSELNVGCAFLDGGELDRADHHNLVVMYDGYLLMPWAPEFGGGGLTFWEFDDPCAPVFVGTGFSDNMRETHSIGFSDLGGRWAVVDQLGLALTPGRGGIQFWDISDPTAPEAVSSQEFPGFVYPDAYARVTLSVFWQVPYVYVGGADNGIFIVDASDPRAPVLVGQYVPDPIMRVGQVQVIGPLLIATTAEGPRTLLLDVSDPTDPQPIPGGDFLARDSGGDPREAYFTNMIGGHIYYANKDGGGGIIVYDIRDPETPTLAGENISNGNGGYVFVHEGTAFVGESRFAGIYDVSDLSNITEMVRLNLEGDLDTVTPIGNVAVLSVDADAVVDQASEVVPYAMAPDSNAPEALWAWPADGATGVATTARFGVSFGEMIDVRSAHVGSVRLYRTDAADANAGRVLTVVSTQETIVNVHPLCPLETNTEYTLELVAGGVEDFSGNALAAPVRVSFRTGAE